MDGGISTLALFREHQLQQDENKKLEGKMGDQHLIDDDDDDDNEDDFSEKAAQTPIFAVGDTPR